MFINTYYFLESGISFPDIQLNSTSTQVYTLNLGDSVVLSLANVVSYWLPSSLLQVTWYELTSSGNVTVTNSLRHYITLSNQLAILDADWTAGTTRTFFARVRSTLP